MNVLSAEIRDKLNLLEEWLKKRNGSIVAFSGGIDSTLLLYLARKFQGRTKAIGVIADSESLKRKDLNWARQFCAENDIHLEVIKTKELTDSRYNENPMNRCFFCKEHLYTDIGLVQSDYPDFDVLSGTNFDDLGDYRPGIEAGKKYDIQSPFVECKITKDELRQIARYLDIPNWNKPASPCLSSRIPYNQTVTAEKLKQVEDAENLLNTYGFNDVRVRHFGTLGKIEVLKQDLPKLRQIEDEIVNKIKAIGFEQCEIDAEGLVSGKMNRAIGKK